MTTTSQHILVVEDDEMVRAFMALHLEIEGYTVTLAGNAREMIRALTGGHPDLILLDLDLPDGDGLSLAQKVREYSSIPIIISTARNSQEDRLLGLDIGADDYLTKPFDPKDLIVRVRNLLEQSKAATPPNPTTASEEKESPSSLPIIKLSLATFCVIAAIAGFRLLAPGNETVQQISTPASACEAGPLETILNRCRKGWRSSIVWPKRPAKRVKKARPVHPSYRLKIST